MLIKKLSLYIILLFLVLIFIFPFQTYSLSTIKKIYPGSLVLKTINNEKGEYLYKIWIFSDNPIIINILDQNISTKIITKHDKGDYLNTKEEKKNSYIISSAIDGYLLFSIVANIESINLKVLYKDPYKAFVGFAKTYQEFAVPWHKRIYIENYITPIKGNLREYPDNLYNISSLVEFGAPYSWGGKDFPDVIAQKIKENGKVSLWQDYYNDKTKHPTNLDALESCYDSSRGPENPYNWTGVDCSGLIEKCADLSGLIYDYHNSPIISNGDFRGAKNFLNVKEGDVLVLLRDNSICHFGLISRKGMTIDTTYMIQSAWFTSLRYNTNSILKVIETSIGEFRSLYSWEIIRFNEK